MPRDAMERRGGGLWLGNQEGPLGGGSRSWALKGRVMLAI